MTDFETRQPEEVDLTEIWKGYRVNPLVTLEHMRALEACKSKISSNVVPEVCCQTGRSLGFWVAGQNRKWLTRKWGWGESSVICIICPHPTAIQIGMRKISTLKMCCWKWDSPFASHQKPQRYPLEHLFATTMLWHTGDTRYDNSYPVVSVGHSEA